MSDVVSELGACGLVPVVKIDRASDAVALGKALVAGGLPCAEITFRTDAAEESIRGRQAAAEESIRGLAAALPDMILGAGTVLSVAQAERAVAAGARFIVSPGFSAAVVDWCLAKGVPVLPGAATPTEVMAVLEKGITLVKFFPAEAYGGTGTIKALSAPFPNVRFMPTGGINAGNLANYLALSCVHAAGGSWMVEGKLISGGRFDEITRLAADARAIVRQVRGS